MCGQNTIWVIGKNAWLDFSQSHTAWHVFVSKEVYVSVLSAHTSNTLLHYCVDARKGILIAANATMLEGVFRTLRFHVPCAAHTCAAWLYTGGGGVFYAWVEFNSIRHDFFCMCVKSETIHLFCTSCEEGLSNYLLFAIIPKKQASNAYAKFECFENFENSMWQQIVPQKLCKHTSIINGLYVSYYASFEQSNF